MYDVFESAANGKTRPLAEVVHRMRLPVPDLPPAAAALVTLERRFGMKSGMRLALSRSLRTVAGDYDWRARPCLAVS